MQGKLVRKGLEGGVTGPIQGTARHEQSPPCREQSQRHSQWLLNLSWRQSCCPEAEFPLSGVFLKRSKKWNQQSRDFSWKGKNYPSNSTRMDLEGATGVFARRTAAPLPPARPLLERWRSLGQEMPRSPSIQANGPAWGQTERRVVWGARGGAALGSWTRWREGRAEREPEPGRDLRSRNQAKAGCLQDTRITFHHGCRSWSHNSCTDKRTGSLTFSGFHLFKGFSFHKNERWIGWNSHSNRAGAKERAPALHP